MTREPSVHRRPIIEYLFLALAIAAVAIGLGRLVWYGTQVIVTAADGGGAEEVRPIAMTWWGGRVFIYPDGEDYFTAIKRREDDLRAVNYVIGVVLDKHVDPSADGPVLLVPADLDLMGGGEWITVRELADGSEIVYEMDVFASNRMSLTSPIPIETDEYDPVLTSADLAAIPADRRVGPYPFDVYFVTPPPGAAQRFVLHTDEERSEVLIVPVEYSPSGAAR